jgi:myo-inositol-1(or 4)-monophosphatase
MIDLQEALFKVQKWVKKAGALQREKLGKRGLRVSVKSGDELISEVDEMSEKLLLEAVSEHYPGHAILSEESGRCSGDESEYLWVIDSLDGTGNFSRGISHFAISVALRYRGETVLGTVYQPVLEELFQAVKGSGAFLNGKQIKVSEQKVLKEAFLGSCFPYDKSTCEDNNVNYFAHFVSRVRGVAVMNSPAYDLACVAAGRFDGYWGINFEPWDVEAGALLVKEAGGEVIFFTEKRGVSLAAGNRAILNGIVREMQNVDLNGNSYNPSR